MASALAGYFRGLAGRLESTLAPALRTEQKALKAGDVSAVQLFNAHNWEFEKKELYSILRQEYIKLSAQAFDDVGNLIANTRGQGNVGSVSVVFDLNGRNMKQVLNRLGKQVTKIDVETRWRLSRVIVNGTNEGLHPSAIAKNIADKARSMYLGAFNGDITRSRAYMIARTETAHAYTWSSMAAYRESGIVKKVVCYDSPDCGWIGHNGIELANGTHRTLDEAEAHPTSHPNCVRAFAPAFGQEAPGIRDRKTEPAKGAPGPKDDLYANPKSFSGARYGIYGDSPLEKWAAQIYDNAQGVTPNMRQTFASYQGFGYRSMNGILRGDDPGDPGSLNRINVLKDYLSRGSTPDAVVAYRGVGSGRAYGFASAMDATAKTAHAQTLIGQSFTEEGFMSTALDPAGAFSGVRLKLTVPKGTNAMPASNRAVDYAGNIPAGGAGDAMSEAELLIQAGRKYVIDSVESDTSGAYGSFRITLVGRILPD